MTILNDYFSSYNLELNLNDTKVLVVSRTAKEAVATLDVHQLNQITHYKYLECLTSRMGRIDEEINGRI